MCLRADRVLLTEGTKWSESAIGTNAMGTALALGTPVQIHSAEHLVRAYHAWTCAAAPVVDPDSGAVIGVIDVTGPQHTRHPVTLALVTTVAQLAQGRLRARMTAHDDALRRKNTPHLRGPGALLSASGRVIAVESCAEILTLLSLHPTGLSTEALAIALYGVRPSDCTFMYCHVHVSAER